MCVLFQWGEEDCEVVKWGARLKPLVTKEAWRNPVVDGRKSTLNAVWVPLLELFDR